MGQEEEEEGHQEQELVPLAEARLEERKTAKTPRMIASATPTTTPPRVEIPLPLPLRLHSFPTPRIEKRKKSMWRMTQANYDSLEDG